MQQVQYRTRFRYFYKIFRINFKFAFSEKVAEAALKFIAAPGLIFLTRPVAAVTGCGIVSNTSLVVNLGWSEFTGFYRIFTFKKVYINILVSTVVHGVPLIWNEKTSDQSLENLSKSLQKSVFETNDNITEKLFPLKYAEDVLARLGYN